MNTANTHRITKAKEKLAAGILLQARRDLRHFHSSRKAAEVGLYLDAYNWVVSENQKWPFSFLNVCKRLHFAPEQLRRELLHEVSLNAFAYWNRRVGQRLRAFHVFLHRVVRSTRGNSKPAGARLVHSLP